MKNCLLQLKKIFFSKIDFVDTNFKPHYLLETFFFNGSDDTTLKGNILNKTL